MRKFNNVYKEKQVIANKLHETKLLKGFKKIYLSLLEQYNTTDIKHLDEAQKLAFETELNEFWNKKDGLTKKGQKFLKSKQLLLTENSTVPQKKQYFLKKAETVIDETLRKAKVKDKIYQILDEMYKETKSTDINDVLNPKAINKVITESFQKSLGKLLSEINYEITDEDINE